MPNHTKHKPFRRWPLFLIASPAAVAVWSGWVGLGGKTGFGPVHLFPGVNVFGLNNFILNTAITLPIGVEAYGAYALGAWLHPATPRTAKKFARRSAIGSLGLGMLGQIAFHLMAAAHINAAPWWITMLVAALPVVTLGFGAGLTHLLREQDDEDEDVAERTQDAPAAVRPPMAEAWPASDGEEVEALTPAGARGRRADAQWRRAVRYVKRNPGCTGKQLAEHLGVSDSHASRILSSVREAIAAEQTGSDGTVSDNLTDDDPSVEEIAA